MKKRKLKKKFKFSMITVVALAIFAALTNLSVRADGNEVYDANSWDTFKNRTREEIAEKYGISWKTLYDLNKNIIGNNPNIIKPGQILKLNCWKENKHRNSI